MLPYSLRLLGDCLPGVQVPGEPFDPNGEWDSRYTVWNPARDESAKSELLGSLHIHRKLTPNGNIRLQVTQVTKMAGLNGSGITKGGVTCANDELTSPIRWQTDFEVKDTKGKTVAYTKTSISGEASKGVIVLHREKDSRIKAADKISSNWSLFDAVQRLPFDSGLVEFDLIEELELLKPGQRLSSTGMAEVEIGGRLMKLHSFQQVGRGILPIDYWLDDNHRLIIAVGGRHAFLLDSVLPKAAP